MCVCVCVCVRVCVRVRACVCARWADLHVSSARPSPETRAKPVRGLSSILWALSSALSDAVVILSSVFSVFSVFLLRPPPRWARTPHATGNSRERAYSSLFHHLHNVSWGVYRSNAFSCSLCRHVGSCLRCTFCAVRVKDTVG